MSGFAAVFDPNGQPEHDAVFGDFVRLVAGYKSLNTPEYFVAGEHCAAAKLDSASSLHTCSARDAETGSWLIAAGTVIDAQDVSPNGRLDRLLKDYLAQGESVFARCDGLFGLVAYNGLMRRLAVVSDPFGYFSIFYGSRDGRTFIATSGLAVARQVQSEPSETGVHCFLRSGKVFGEMTIWRDVKRMRAATVLAFSPEAMRESVFWTPQLDASLAKLSLDEAVEASEELVRCVLQRNLAREGKVWTDLTGGFDTRFLVMMLDRAGIPFKANFVGAPAHPDVKIARQIVETLGWDYRHFQLPATWPRECPAYLADTLGRGDGHLNVLLSMRALWVHRQESREYSALLSGLGGEMWRGPIWGHDQSTLGQSSAVQYHRQLWSFMHPVPEPVFRANTDRLVRDEVLRQFAEVGEREPDAPNTLKLDRLWTYRETAHVGVWASVAAGLVRIIPALFSKDIVSHVMSLDYRWKAKNLLVRNLFARYQPFLANLEIEGRGPAGPRRITNFHRFIPSRLAHARKLVNKAVEVKLRRTLWRTRPDEGFSRQEWRRSIVKFAEAEGLLRPGAMRSDKLYNSGALQALLAQAQAGADFTHDEFLGRVLTLEMALHAADTAIS